MPNHSSPTQIQDDQQALLLALEQLLGPVARLCLSKAVPVQAMQEVMRRAYVHAAAEYCEGLNAARLTSRISTMTGLTRREVARVQSMQSQHQSVPTRAIATDVLTAWSVLPEYVNKKGLPIPLPRTGLAPSFEALAHQVTKDVHPRSILADMLRLGLVVQHSNNDTVAVVDQLFVPREDWSKMLGFLGANVGEHLQASVDNILGDGRQHFEQSLLADELSKESLDTAKSMITAQWRSLMTELGPQLQALMNEDTVQGRAKDQQLRIGLYSYMTTMKAQFKNQPPSSGESGND
jgi:hypothetical protein